MRQLISEITSSHEGKKVLIRGFVQETRDFGSLKFLVIRDVSGIIQVTAKKETADKKVFQEITKIPRASSIEVEGKVVKSKQAPGGREIV
ncbi:MAG: OB-fold nucleic acid binding domain-containing protein, partial [Nanoarchaeota archaeon]